MKGILCKTKKKLGNYDDEMDNMIYAEPDRMIRTEVKMLLSQEIIDYLFALANNKRASDSSNLFKLLAGSMSDKPVQDIVQYKESGEAFHRLFNVSAVSCGIKVDYIEDKNLLVMSLGDSVFI